MQNPSLTTPAAYTTTDLYSCEEEIIRASLQ